MPERRVMIVDDDSVFRSILATELEDMGYQAVQSDGADTLRRLRASPVDVVLLDVVMPHVNGIDLLKSVREISPPPEVVMLTGHASVDNAVQALRFGARDFLTKPVERAALDCALKRCFTLDSDLGPPPQAVRPLSPGPGHQLVGYSPAMQRVRSAISRFAAFDSTVLIQGESGTGKDLVAQQIHRNSRRSRGPFLIVDCTALAEQLLASELFGYEKGSFTGAQTTKKGIFAMAEGGSAFLDEIGDMAPALQVKLLRVVETKSFRPVGGRKAVSVDVRILAATNSDLNKAVQRGSFRKDLYYRLAVCRINLPALRDHAEDIPLLVDYFRTRLALSGSTVPIFSPAALRKLACYDWPGNVRELRNLIEQIGMESTGSEIGPEDIDFGRVAGSATGLGRTDTPWPPLRHLETDYIRQVLMRTGGNKSAAARALGIDRKTLDRRLKAKTGEE